MPDGWATGWLAMMREGAELIVASAAPTGGTTYCFQGIVDGGQVTGQHYGLHNYYTTSPSQEVFVVQGTQDALQFHSPSQDKVPTHTPAPSDSSDIDFPNLLQICTEGPSNGSVPPSEGASALSATGSWAGDMYGETNTYTLQLDITEAPDGSLNATARQVELDKSNGTATGQVGTEVLSGTRSGSEIVLQGQYFEPGAPSSWLLDTMQLTMSADGSQLSGTYVCAQCGTSPMQATRQ